MKVYCFKVKVYKDGDWFIGEIPELHVHDQARTLRELENELKDAVDSSAAFAQEHKSALKSPALKILLSECEPGLPPNLSAETQ